MEMPANRPYTVRVSGTHRAVERLYAVAYKTFKNPLCSTRCSKSFGVKDHTFFFHFGMVTYLGQTSLCVPSALVAVMDTGAAESGGTSQERTSQGIALPGYRPEVFPSRPPRSGSVGTETGEVLSLSALCSKQGFGLASFVRFCEVGPFHAKGKFDL
jgi:hypothetical protein